MDRTILLGLQPNSEQALLLQRNVQKHANCFHTVAHEGFMTSCGNGVELHKQTSYPLRASYPDLPAQLVCAARVKAIEAVKSALDRRKKGSQSQHAARPLSDSLRSTLVLGQMGNDDV